MVLRRFLACVSVCALCLFLVFFGDSFKVYADVLPADGYMMTAQESVSLFGQSFDVSYMDSTGVYHNASAIYQGTSQISETNGYVDDAGYLNIGREFLFYRMYDGNHALNSQPQNVTVRLKPQYSIFDTEYIYTAIAVMSDADDATTNITAYNSPVWKWIWDGNIVNFDSVSIADNNVLPHLNFTSRGQYSYDFVRAYMSSQSLTSGSSIEATFDHVRTWSSGYADVFIMVGCPYISSGASGASGTLDTTGFVTTTITTTQNINVNVDVDLDETNGLLGTIATAIGNVSSAIIGGIRDLFVPTHEQLQTFLSDLRDILYDKIAPLADAVNQLDRVFNAITYQGDQSYIRISPVTIHTENLFQGTDIIPAQTMTIDLNPNVSGVPLLPDIEDPLDNPTNGLIYACKHVISIVCTLAFINMCKHKIDLIINPDSETYIEGD